MQPPFGHYCYAPLGQRTPRARHPAAPQLLRHSACTLTQRAIRPLRLCYEPFGQCTPRARHSAARCMLLWPSSLRTHCLRAAIPSYARKRSRPPRSTPLARPRQRRVMYPPGRSARRSRLRGLVQRLRRSLYALRHRKGCGSIPAAAPTDSSGSLLLKLRYAPATLCSFCRGATPLSLAKGSGFDSRRAYLTAGYSAADCLLAAMI